MADIRDKVMEKLNTEWDKLSRQQRRRMKQQNQKHEARTTFTRQELREANAASYELGKQIALKAAAKALKLGDVRLARVTEELARQEYENLVKPIEIIDGVNLKEKFEARGTKNS
ncbi:hypothetical protein [Exiguobacterium sp. s181]|uniref:hypothetical protein n=1 Tax=Exiguobacterium sp. s181 TaxID=2751288 RepID=UPI001BEA69F3|nr:hypothetical protein [Exiguobacterium sp. s181]